MTKHILRAALLLLSSSCSSSSHWSVQHQHTGNADFNSSKLSYYAPDKVNGIDLEILSQEQSMRIYLNVHSRRIPAFKGNPQEALIKITVEDQVFELIGARHQGGQRLLLPESILGILISQLKEGKSIFIELEGYSGIIHGEQFAKKFQKIAHPPAFESPFHLPF